MLSVAVAGCGDRTPSAPARTDGALVVVTTAETPPYSYVDAATGEVVGDEIDIVREAAKKIGRRVEIRLLRFEQLLLAVKTGEADMAASGISITGPRMADVDFSVPYAYDGGMFLYRAGERVPTMILAERIRIAVLESTTYDFYLCSHGIDPVRFRSYTDAVEALRSRDVDAVFNDGVVVKVSAAESNGELAVSRFETRENFGIAVRKDMPELRAALDQVIRERGGGRDG